MRKAIVQGALVKAVKAGRSEVVQHATSAAGEMLRVRREPAVVAARRVRRARRRVGLWAAGTAVPAAGVIVEVAGYGAAAFGSAEILRTMIYLALLVVCVTALVRAVVELRQRTAAQRSLPPPAPARTAVAVRIRPLMTQLGEYSDGLRKLAGLTGIDPGSALGRELQLDIITSADAAEHTLRQRAAELTDIEAAAAGAPLEARPRLRGVADQLTAEIKEGVGEYGAFVGAVSEIVVAGRTLRGESTELTDRTDQLRGLATGMRELAG